MKEDDRYRIIDDLVIIGKAFPQILQDGRATCCTAGWSPTRGFIRIYPIPPFSEKLKRWNIISAKVEINPSDWRDESWKICDSKNPEEALRNVKVVGKLNRKEQIRLIKEILPNQCPCGLNEKRISLGIVKPKIIDTLWDGDKLKIKYECEQDCLLSSTYTKKDGTTKIYSPHKQQVLEWGVYEWVRKHPEKKKEVIDNLRLFDKDYDVYFFVGNSYKAPTSFMIISILRFKK